MTINWSLTRSFKKIQMRTRCSTVIVDTSTPAEPFTRNCWMLVWRSVYLVWDTASLDFYFTTSCRKGKGSEWWFSISVVYSRRKHNLPDRSHSNTHRIPPTPASMTACWKCAFRSPALGSAYGRRTHRKSWNAWNFWSDKPKTSEHKNCRVKKHPAIRNWTLAYEFESAWHDRNCEIQKLYE